MKFPNKQEMKEGIAGRVRLSIIWISKVQFFLLTLYYTGWVKKTDSFLIQISRKQL